MVAHVRPVLVPNAGVYCATMVRVVRGSHLHHPSSNTLADKIDLLDVSVSEKSVLPRQLLGKGDGATTMPILLALNRK